MRHTFLHLSDLHYRTDWPEATDLVWKAFCADLATQLPYYDDPYLVFSGDLVFAGGTENLYSAFVTNIAEGLNRHFSRDRIICVPGNHDISQEALRPFATLQLGALDAQCRKAQSSKPSPYGLMKRAAGTTSLG